MNESNDNADSRFYILIKKSSDEVSLSKLVETLAKAGLRYAIIGENNSSFLLYKPHIVFVDDGLGHYVKGIYVGKSDNSSHLLMLQEIILKNLMVIFLISRFLKKLHKN